MIIINGVSMLNIILANWNQISTRKKKQKPKFVEIEHDLVIYFPSSDRICVFSTMKSILAVMLNRLENYFVQNKRLTPIAMHILWQIKLTKCVPNFFFFSALVLLLIKRHHILYEKYSYCIIYSKSKFLVSG